VHCIDDKPNGVIVNHNADWSGEVRIAWYDASARRDTDPALPELQECWCDGYDLVAGRFTLVAKAPVNILGRFEMTTNADPPVHVLTRAVALAVETFLRRKMERAIDELFIKRGKL